MVIKKIKNKKSSLLYNNKTSENKTETNLLEGKFELKPSFKKAKTKVLPTIIHKNMLQNIHISDREAKSRYIIT